MQTYLVSEVWQLALVYQVRLANAQAVKVSLTEEFDEEYGKEYHYLLVVDGEQGVGSLRLNFDHETYAKLERVAVIPEYQGRGIGQAMIHEAEEWARREGYERIVLHSKHSANGFYEKLDYKKDESVELDLGPDGKRQIYFEKYLNE